MPVIDHALKGKPADYTSANHRKWEFRCGLYQRHLELYLDNLYECLQRSGAGSVLDAGCGEGIVYRAMRERGWSGAWTGFDFSREAVEYTRRASPEASWQQASAHHIPFADSAFDIVLSSQVLEHIPDPGRALREYARVARRRLVLSVPLEPYFRALTWLSVRLRIGGDPGHVNFWNGSMFRRFAVRAGRLEEWRRTTIYQIAVVDVTADAAV